jgi:CRP-like cAMP-binding protein
MEKRIKGTFTLRRMFPTFSEEDIQFLKADSSIMRLKKAQNLFIAGDSPRAVYGVANGCLKIVRETQEGESVITRIVRPGQVLGIREIFAETKYTRTAVALKDSEIFSINANLILKLINKTPEISLHFIKVFCQEIAKLEKRIELDVYRSARMRVATVIHELFQIFGDENKDTFDPPLNRKDIAELADVTPETVSRAIAELKKAGILEVRGASFRIADLALLKEEIEDK